MTSFKRITHNITLLFIFFFLVECGSFSDFGTTTVKILVSGRPELSMIYELIQKAELTELLESKTPRTYLLPTNSAFDNMQPAIIEEIMPAGGDKTALRAFIKNHILVEEYNYDQLGRRYSVENLIGNAIGIYFSPYGLTFDKHALIIEKDLYADDGTIHVVNNYLLPPPQYLEK